MTKPALQAAHRGGGSYSVMDGDTEVAEHLTKADAEAFNDLDRAGQDAWLAARPPAPDKAAAPKASAKSEPDGSAVYSVKNITKAPQAVMASGAHVTIEPKVSRDLVLSGEEKEAADASGWFEIEAA